MNSAIRPAQCGDEQAAAGVVRACYDLLGWGWYPDEYHADLYDLDKFYFQKGHSFWVAQQDGVVIGTAALDRFALLPRGEPTVIVGGIIRVGGTDCSLERLYVHPEARGLGVGRALFEKTVQTAREEGRRGMEIWSDVDLTTAHRLYQMAGAVIVGERLCHDPSQAPEFGMFLTLEDA